MNARRITLRDMRLDNGIRSALDAEILANGDFLLSGQDLGVPEGWVSDDDEYEYFKRVAAEHLPMLVEQLGGSPGDDLLDILARDWTGKKSFDFERVLGQGKFPVQFHSF